MSSAGFDGLDLHDALRAAQAAAAARGHGWTALHAAAEFGHADATRFLLEHGMPPATRDALGLTPLHAAAQHGRVQAARILLAAGADIEARDGLGNTPGRLAAMAGHHALASLLANDPPRAGWWRRLCGRGGKHDT